MLSVSDHPLLRRCLFFLLPLFAIPSLVRAQWDYPSAKLSTVWINSNSSLEHTVSFPDGSQVRSILLRQNSSSVIGPTFACGFYCSPPCDTFLLAVFVVSTNSGGGITLVVYPRVVWSANRDHPVAENAVLNFTAAGDLVLHDSDGTVVWSASTSGKSVASMNITGSGNLVLFDQNGTPIWQSFDHPADTLVLGQRLRGGQRVVANKTMAEWTTGQVYITVLSDGLYAFAGFNPPQQYYPNTIASTTGNNSAYMNYLNGGLEIFTGSDNRTIALPSASSVQFMRLEFDGRLRVYDWNQSLGWQAIYDVLKLDVCDYPLVCGEYGICSYGECTCPRGEDESSTTFFQQVDINLPSRGCSLETPLSCQSMQKHLLITNHNVSHFNYFYFFPGSVQGIDEEESCKQACLNNCSCKAALFQYGEKVSNGDCYLLSELFSLKKNEPLNTHYNSTAYIKVQIPTAPSPNSAPSANKKGAGIGVIVSIIGAILFAFFIGGIIIVLLRRKKAIEEEEDDFRQVPGMPTRFTFEELKLATDNFCKKLGEGGFGSVYEGKIGDERIAVKHLDGVGQGKREFLAEVETIGSIHHIKLVRLIGFCAEKSQRLLVYEYMCNGSLDKWIFSKGQHGTLDWQTKCKIIADIAKGLSYLHEECRQRIAHLDIKPQNILLDEDFNAKVSDFGLAKLIDRNQDQVMTRMRGTPGYLAPEWLTSIITEKVDIYSFGVMVVEIVCGRKNLDYSQPEESFHLISLLQEMIKSDRLLDLLDRNSNHTKLHENEAIEMIKLAVWCLQTDSNRRPSMSTVVKVLQGAAAIDAGLDYDIVTKGPIISRKGDHHYGYHLDASPPPSASLLSGPR